MTGRYFQSHLPDQLTINRGQCFFSRLSPRKAEKSYTGPDYQSRMARMNSGTTPSRKYLRLTASGKAR